jgi:hypothetical protein
MEMKVLRTFTSKKNQVQLVQEDLDPRRPPRVLKTMADPIRAEREAQILEFLSDRISVPKLLARKDNSLLLEYIPGVTLADWLEQAEKENPNRVTREVEDQLESLLQWLTGFYIALEQGLGKAGIMGDVNLRNFIVGETLTGIDFEEVGDGHPSEDLGKIAAFILMYAPERTPWKLQLVDFWLTRAGQVFSLQRQLLVNEMQKELEAMQIRRQEKTAEGF